MPRNRNSKNSKNNNSSICSWLSFLPDKFYLDKVLYARKTGDIEEIAGNGVRGDDITVEDAMVSRNVSKAAHKIKDFSNKEAENCVFWWTWNGT